MRNGAVATMAVEGKQKTVVIDDASFSDDSELREGN